MTGLVNDVRDAGNGYYILFKTAAKVRVDGVDERAGLRTRAAWHMGRILAPGIQKNPRDSILGRAKRAERGVLEGLLHC